jgi:hypothetical protein
MLVSELIWIHTWMEHKSRYLQAKLKLYGLFHCNAALKPDLRTTNYAPEFPPICRLLSPFSSVTTTAAIFAVVITAATVYVASTVAAILNITAAFTVIAAVFTVSAAVIIVTAAVIIVTAAISSASAATAIFIATAAISVYSASASDRSPHLVNSVRPWSYHPLAPFLQSLMNI